MEEAAPIESEAEAGGMEAAAPAVMEEAAPIESEAETGGMEAAAQAEMVEAVPIESEAEAGGMEEPMAMADQNEVEEVDVESDDEIVEAIKAGVRGLYGIHQPNVAADDIHYNLYLTPVVDGRKLSSNKDHDAMIILVPLSMDHEPGHWVSSIANKTRQMKEGMLARVHPKAGGSKGTCVRIMESFAILPGIEWVSGKFVHGAVAAPPLEPTRTLLQRFSLAVNLTVPAFRMLCLAVDKNHHTTRMTKLMECKGVVEDTRILILSVSATRKPTKEDTAVRCDRIAFLAEPTTVRPMLVTDLSEQERLWCDSGGMHSLEEANHLIADWSKLHEKFEPVSHSLSLLWLSLLRLSLLLDACSFAHAQSITTPGIDWTLMPSAFRPSGGSGTRRFTKLEQEIEKLNVKGDTQRYDLGSLPLNLYPATRDLRKRQMADDDQSFDAVTSKRLATEAAAALERRKAKAAKAKAKIAEGKAKAKAAAEAVKIEQAAAAKKALAKAKADIDAAAALEKKREEDDEARRAEEERIAEREAVIEAQLNAQRTDAEQRIGDEILRQVQAARAKLAAGKLPASPDVALMLSLHLSFLPHAMPQLSLLSAFAALPLRFRV